MFFKTQPQKSGQGGQGNQDRQMLEQLPLAVITCDVDTLVIDYVNPETIRRLKDIEHVLPCKAADIVGQCIDIFHKDPSHQRTMLRNESNLPHKTTIEIGGEYLDLNVSALHNANGAYNKIMLAWSVVTKRVLAERKAVQQEQMLDQLPLGVMFLETKDFTIQYMNKFSSTTLKTLEQHLPVKVENMIGQCVDIFHKDPSHQRRILSDPSNLPYRASIGVGPEKLDLNANAVMDHDGNYVGSMLTWTVITTQLQVADSMTEMSQSVSSAATEMRSSAESLTATASETSEQSQAVAEAAEQLAESISEITQQVSRAATITGSAVEQARESNRMVNGLSETAVKIGDVVKMITDIAGQTNLLALNATIEAARAGDAGKGFAVVANEVKALATQTARATEEISEQIGSIQEGTGQAVSAIESIVTVIDEISSIATAISAAVEEQAASTQEVTTNITNVTRASSETGSAASQVLGAAGELSERSVQLQTEVEKFLNTVTG